jgi:hypothetical protein
MPDIDLETPQEISSTSTDVTPAESSPAAEAVAATATAGGREAFEARMDQLEGKTKTPTEEKPSYEKPVE